MNRDITIPGLALAIGLSAVIAIPSTAFGQSVQGWTVPADRNEAADEIHERAAALYARPDKHEQAAHLLRQECELRSPEDPLTYRCLSMGAKLFYYAGELLDAQIMMEEAAKNALARGEVFRAAESYIEVAAIARKQKRQGPKARAFLEKARLLTTSPLLGEPERSWLIARVEAQTRAIVSAVDP
jgi:hypothetical protein